MIIVLWIVNALLALAFLATGGMKLLRPIEKLKAVGMGWIDDFPSAAPRLIGAAEIVGAFGLILPLATGMASILTPIAATALAVLMVGAIVVHVRRHESAAPAIVLGILSIVSAAIGFVVLG